MRDDWRLLLTAIRRPDQTLEAFWELDNFGDPDDLSGRVVYEPGWWPEWTTNEFADQSEPEARRRARARLVGELDIADAVIAPTGPRGRLPNGWGQSALRCYKIRLV